MILYIVIGIILLFFAFSFLKLEHHTKKIKFILLLVIVLVLYFSIMTVFSSKRVDLSSPKGVVNAIYVYFGWMGQTASSLWDIGTDTVRTVGNAVKINSTEQTPKR